MAHSNVASNAGCCQWCHHRQLIVVSTQCLRYCAFTATSHSTFVHIATVVHIAAFNTDWLLLWMCCCCPVNHCSVCCFCRSWSIVDFRYFSMTFGVVATPCPGASTASSLISWWRYPLQNVDCCVLLSMIFTADFSRWFQEKCMASPSGGSSAARDVELPLKCLPLKATTWL